MPDVVVVGGGVAGMRAAVAASQAGASVALITRTHPLRSYSTTIQDGLNAAIGPGDSGDLHAQETVQAGGYLADQELVRSVCGEGPALVEELDRIGVPFNRGPAQELARIQLEGASRPRTVFADDMTGHVITQVMYEQTLKAGFQVLEEWVVVALAIEDSRCAGVAALEIGTGNLEVFPAKAVVLATGGPRRLYEPSTASLACSGDGLALALRAGARLIDMEMIQYHPFVVKGTHLALTPLLNPGRGDGRDGTVDLTAHDAVGSSRFYTTRHRLNGLLGLNPAKSPVPVQSAMHQLLGGIAADEYGATAVEGLYAAGACAGSTFHGACALPGNGLLESLVLAKRAGEAAAGSTTAGNAPPASWQEKTREELGALFARPTGSEVAALRKQLATLMDQRAGQRRDEAGLREAISQVDQIEVRYQNAGLNSQRREYNHGIIHYLELGHLIDIARAVIASARARQESRGVHVRTDFPDQSPEWARHLLVSWDGKGVSVDSRPVQMQTWQPASS